ncbi:MAG: glycosyltransferase [Kiritimatiellia bacterium]
MKILQVIGGLASSSGTTPAVLALSNRLAAAGHHVDIFYVSGRTPDTVRPFNPRVGLEGFPLTGPRLWAGSRRLYKALMARAGDYDLVHGYSLWLFTNIAVSRACRRAGRPYIISPQGALDDWALRHHGLRKRIYAALFERRILNCADCIQCVTPHEALLVQKFALNAKTVVIPNGVEIGPFDPACREYPVEFLFLSRLHPKKGLDILIPAFALAKKECPEIRLTIVGGDGGSGYRTTVEGLLSSQGLNDCVRLTGELRGTEKTTAFESAGIFVLTSRSEGHPLAALEAMERGLPVIITPQCYLPEVTEMGAGIVTEPEVKEVARAIVRLASSRDARRQMGCAGRRLIEERFSADRVASLQLKLYKETASKYGRI